TVTGQCNATVSNVPTATDNCNGSINGTTTDPLSYSNQGTYTIVWTFTDSEGNSSTQNQTVIIDDTTAPVADAASLPTVTGQCNATVSNVPTATDNCNGSINGTTTDPLSYSNQGTYTIVWTFTD
ncbi:HYR-like domain-containing protein, partial [Salegentibacter chungangensis]